MGMRYGLLEGQVWRMWDDGRPSEIYNGVKWFIALGNESFVMPVSQEEAWEVMDLWESWEADNAKAKNK